MAMTVVRFGMGGMLDFSVIPAITDDEFETRVTKFGELDNIQTLILGGCSNITDKSFRLIELKFCLLDILDLSGTKVTDQVFQSMNFIWMIPTVKFHNCYHITPRASRDIPEGWGMNNCGSRPKLNLKTGEPDVFLDAAKWAVVHALECPTEAIRDGYNERRYPVGSPYRKTDCLNYYAEADSAIVETYFSEDSPRSSTSEVKQERCEGDVKKDTPAAIAVSVKCQDTAPEKPATTKDASYAYDSVGPPRPNHYVSDNDWRCALQDSECEDH